MCYASASDCLRNFTNKEDRGIEAEIQKPGDELQVVAFMGAAPGAVSAKNPGSVESNLGVP